MRRPCVRVLGFRALTILAVAVILASGGGQRPSAAADAPVDPHPELKRLSPTEQVWVDAARKEVIVGAKVAMSDGPIEVFACPEKTKEHEAVVATHGSARLIHTALLAIGLDPGSPVSFDPEYVAARGPAVSVRLRWKDPEGGRHEARAQDWIRDARTGKALDAEWVFAGSAFWKDPQDGTEYYQADGGDLICVSNFPTATLDLPIQSSQSNDALLFEVFAGRVPPRNTPVELVLAAGPKAAGGGDPAAPPPAADLLPTVGSIERLDPRFDELVPKHAVIEVLATGFAWAEGPVWVRGSAGLPADSLLFSDIPPNRIHRWNAADGLSLFMHPSGFTGPLDADYGGERGSNGLTLDREGRLILCEHGDRRVARLEPDGGKRTLADAWEGRRLNSPNDAAVHSSGAIYFTDPPYGLPARYDDPRRELDFCGVYRIAPDGSLDLVCRTMTRPNGIAFAPDEKTLYIAQSDPQAPIWKAFAVQPDGTLDEGRVFFDATELKKTRKGLPDGLKVDVAGNLFATGPGGVLVLSPDGTHLGTILTGQATANCGFGDDGRTLYITADSLLCRVRLTTAGPLPGGSRR